MPPKRKQTTANDKAMKRTKGAATAPAVSHHPSPPAAPRLAGTATRNGSVRVMTEEDAASLTDNDIIDVDAAANVMQPERVNRPKEKEPDSRESEGETSEAELSDCLVSDHSGWSTDQDSQTG
jgi:hypothetical protein